MTATQPPPPVAQSAVINPLANPKGIKLACELCHKPALLVCSNCNLNGWGIFSHAMWSTAEHKKVDWEGIHWRICKMLVPLRTPAPFLTLEEDRRMWHDDLTDKKRELIRLTRMIGEKLLFEGRHEQAIPAATQNLKFSLDIYGITSLELVPSYLLLADASIGLGHLDQAEEYCAQAQWTVLKTPDASNVVRYKVFRILGLLHSAKGNYSEALRHFADDIFHASVEHGSHDIHVAGGIFHMANVFFLKNKLSTVHSLYKKVLDIWYDYLMEKVSARCRVIASIDENQLSAGVPSFDTKKSEEDTLDEAQEAEAKKTLHAIDDFYMESSDAALRTRITYALAMLYFMLAKFDTALKYSEEGATFVSNKDDNMRSELDMLTKASRRHIHINEQQQRTRASFYSTEEAIRSTTQNASIVESPYPTQEKTMTIMSEVSKSRAPETADGRKAATVSKAELRSSVPSKRSDPAKQAAVAPEEVVVELKRGESPAAGGTKADAPNNTEVGSAPGTEDHNPVGSTTGGVDDGEKEAASEDHKSPDVTEEAAAEADAEVAGAGEETAMQEASPVELTEKAADDEEDAHMAAAAPENEMEDLEAEDPDPKSNEDHA